MQQTEYIYIFLMVLVGLPLVNAFCELNNLCLCLICAALTANCYSSPSSFSFPYSFNPFF